MSEVKKAKEIAELSKKLDSAKSELKTHTEYLESRIRNGQDTTSTRIDVKYAADKVASIKRELNSLS